MSKINPNNDGIDHINVYSKGKTLLGRLLSNFAYTPFEIPNKGQFNTVEGFWYWTITGKEEFREMDGWQCKQLGSKYKAVREHPTENELLEAYTEKLKANPYIQIMLNNNSLPLEHYYCYGDKVIPADKWLWTAKLWEKLK